MRSGVAADIAITLVLDHLEGSTKGSAVIVREGTELQAHRKTKKRIRVTSADIDFVWVMIRMIKLTSYNFATYLLCRLFARPLSDRV